MDYNRDPAAESQNDVEGGDTLLQAFWRAHGKKLVLGTASVALIYVVLESVHQIRIQRAIGHVNRGEYSEALESVKGRRLGFFRNKVADAITAHSRYHLSLQILEDVVPKSNWFVAQKHLSIAVDCGRGIKTYASDIERTVDAWRQGLDGLVEDGEFVKCRNSLDRLLSISFDEPSHRALVDRVSYDTTLKLVFGFTEHEAWTAAFREIQALAEHPLIEQDQLKKLKSLIRDAMLDSRSRAVAAKQFERAEAISRLIESHFPESNVGDEVLREIRYSKLITAGEEHERRERFDRALESYDRAMQVKHGDREAFARISALRQRLRGYTKEGGVWRKADGEENELARAMRVSSRGSRWRLYTSSTRKTPARVQAVRLRSAGGLTGQWSLQAEGSAGQRTWVVRGEVRASNRSYRSKPLGGIKIAATITDRLSTPLSGKIVEIPLLLPGDARTFEIRLRGDEKEHFVEVGAEP